MTTTRMRNGGTVEDPRLGRLVPTDWEHVERYSIAALPREQQPSNVPVVIGVNWYEAFDRPVLKRIGRTRVHVIEGELGRVRGGHCVCLEPAPKPQDSSRWPEFYDQGQEGACVGFGWSRCMSLLNRVRYDARWLYHEAQRVDEWPGEDYDGTSVRAAADVLRSRGHCALGRGGRVLPEDVDAGIAANRWAQDVDEVLHALGTPERDYVTILNSWGLAYPRRVRMPCEILAVLMTEDGEVAIPTDR